MTPGCTVVQTQAGYAVGNVFLGNFRPHYPSSTIPDICQVSDQAHSFMATLFPASDGHYRQDNAPCHTARIQKWLDEHDSEFLLMSWPLNSPNQTFVVRLGKVGLHYITITQSIGTGGPPVDIMVPDTPGDLSPSHRINASPHGRCFAG